MFHWHAVGGVSTWSRPPEHRLRRGTETTMTDRNASHPEHDYLPAMGHDRLLPLYDSFTWLLGASRVHRRLAVRAGVEPGHRVLEVGCGTGNLALRVQRMQPTAEVVGLDPDPLAL